jgi:hypothetical protein
MKIVDASEVKRQTRTSPATRMIEKIPDGLYTARDMAERFDVNIETIRRLARAKDDKGKDKFKAPSKAAKNGELIIWVYTPEDVDELAEYFGERGKPKTTRPTRKRSAKKE